MNQELLSLAQKGLGDFLESTSQLQEIFAQEIVKITDPDRKKALEEYLGLMRVTQARLQETFPGEVQAMLQGFSDLQNSFSDIEMKKGQLLDDLEGLQRKATASLQEAETKRAEMAKAPKPTSPAILAQQRLAAMAARHGMDVNQSPRPVLKEGSVLQHQLLELLHPKADVKAARAKAIGNIWENWPGSRTEPTEPAEEA
ncbi:MAG: hypothetical protein ACKOS8_15965 [Gemmataceae bacterium]